MQRKDLPERWLRRLEEYTDDKYGADYRYRGKLGATDFSTSSLVRVGFPDGSSAEFRFAFFIAAPDRYEVAVFTEHCGYHILPSVDLTIELLTVAYAPPSDDS